MTRKESDRLYLEATRWAVADTLASQEHLDRVRVEAKQPDMTLREAAVWMTDQLFPDERPSNPWMPGGELAELFGKQVRTTFDDT